MADESGCQSRVIGVLFLHYRTRDDDRVLIMQTVLNRESGSVGRGGCPHLLLARISRAETISSLRVSGVWRPAGSRLPTEATITLRPPANSAPLLPRVATLRASASYRGIATGPGS